ncbi:MAG: EF-hand domain-containing protein [Candidatus Sericytochromatia bacterium]|nr:EF-hand domain-containing protein [Candidatus Sericytochromatia bacterium]
MNQLSRSLLFVASVASLTACGVAPTPRAAAPVVADATFDALSASTLQKAFTRVHRAIFNTIDADKDGWLNEYEVGRHMTMAEFRKADKSQGWGSAGRLSRTEFVDYATRTFLWFHQDRDSFANSFRQSLARAFNRLDTNDDGLLIKNETSLADLRRLGLTFQYPKLHITVPIRKVTPEQFQGADKTGDGKLSQAEFEDLYIEMVVAALGGDAAPAPAPAPPAQPVPPAPPAPAGK